MNPNLPGLFRVRLTGWSMTLLPVFYMKKRVFCNVLQFVFASLNCQLKTKQCFAVNKCLNSEWQLTFLTVYRFLLNSRMLKATQGTASLTFSAFQKIYWKK